jgi:hypothetical protein
MVISPRDRDRALVSIASYGDPAPIDLERRLASAWRLFVQSGAPRDPGWMAVDGALDLADKDKSKNTHSVSVVADIPPTASGIIILAGGVGSGRSFACARLLWRACRHLAEGRPGARAGRWLDAGIMGHAPSYPDRSGSETWPSIRARFVGVPLLVLDDVGASGSTAVADDRARELLEARNRSGSLTIVSTNISDARDHLRLFGARVLDRSELVHVTGASLRTRRLRPSEVPVPTRIREARDRVRAYEDLEPGHAINDSQGASQRVLEAWLRPDVSENEWTARLAEELRTADEQHAAVQAALARTVEHLARPLPDLEAERRAETERLRAAHRAKADRLLAVDTATEAR